jgi:NADPH:quinone reductase-like Zn-dependent oxidoreductase
MGGNDPRACCGLINYNNSDTYEEAIINEGLQAIIWDGMYKCIACLGGKNHASEDVTTRFMAKNLKGVYPHGFYREIFDPNEAMLNKLKRLFELEKQVRMGE